MENLPLVLRYHDLVLEVLPQVVLQPRLLEVQVPLLWKHVLPPVRAVRRPTSLLSFACLHDLVAKSL